MEKKVGIKRDTINEINTGCDMDIKKKGETKIIFAGVDNLVIKPLPSVNLIAKYVGATERGMIIKM
jgi:hypothetical protein